MSEPLVLPLAATTDLERRTADLAGRLATLVGAEHPDAAYLTSFSADLALASLIEHDPPLARLAAGLGLSAAELDIVVLAAMPDLDEGLAAVLRGLHPAGRDGATVGLVTALAAAGLLPGIPNGRTFARRFVDQTLAEGALAALVGSAGDAPWPDRPVRLPAGLVDAISGRSGWPCGASELEPEVVAAVPQALRAEDPNVTTVLQLCARGAAATAVIDPCGDPLGAAARLASLLRGTGVHPAVLLVRDPGPDWATGLTWSALARGQTPVLVLGGDARPEESALAALERAPGPVVVIPAEPPTLRPAPATARRPLVSLTVPALRPAQRRQLWRKLLPDLADPPDVTGAGLDSVLPAARDAVVAAQLTGRPLTAESLRAAVRRRVAADTPIGLRRVQPVAGWPDLVLPDDRLQLLREAVAQVRHQPTVLDQWRFLPGRPGRSGVRLLFSGPPGTGKTLAAEVLAGQIGRELLVVDLSLMVSKWIGETEKNLARAFDAAEHGEAVLFFDEADGLFGRRTEIKDARDRYANLETGYLLDRLSWFAGVAVLATNVRRSIDPAFVRRLEFVVNFDLPDDRERAKLWQVHLPSSAPQAEGLELAAFAARYPISGAQIRNAAVGAGYLAAAGGVPISAHHLAWAVRREYAKAGLAYPGPPTGVPDHSPCEQSRAGQKQEEP